MRRGLASLYLAGLAILAGLVFTQSPGTTDVAIWQAWTNSAVSRGLVRGYAANGADYPPLSDAILYAANRLLAPLGASSFLAIKLSIFFFLLLAALLFWRWTRSLCWALALYFALFLNAVGLGYIDVYFAPFLVLSLWMLKDRRWAWAGTFFALACLTKWQPLIIAPFIGLYLLRVGLAGESGAGAARPTVNPSRDGEPGAARMRFSPAALRPLLRFLAPAVALVVLSLLVFGAQPAWLALRASLSHRYLSGNALNFPWMITHFLHVTRPAEFGGLQNGLASYIETDDPGIVTLPRLLFYLTYLGALLVFLFRAKSFPNLLVFAITGFLCYDIFNTGVHENHLFLAAILSVALMAERPDWRGPALALLLLNNLNLFLFYGVDGELHFSRAFLGLDTALPLSIFAVLFFIYWYVHALYMKEI